MEKNINDDLQVAFFDLDDDVNNKSDSVIKGDKKIKNSKISKNEATKRNLNKKEAIKKISTKKKTNSEKTIKNTKTKSVSNGRKIKVNFTEEDMDKLCEIYDWYIMVKDNIKNLSDDLRNETSISIEKDIIKTKKRITATVDEKIWLDFETICSNSGFTKSELLTQLLKEYILKHKDLV